MIRLTITVENISTVIQVYDRIRVRSGLDENADWDAVSSGTVSDVTTVYLATGVSNYYYNDLVGTTATWYASQYYDSTNSGIISGWSDPILGEAGDIFYNPLYPPEAAYGTADQMIINRIRLYVGDPVGLRREYGEDAASSIHFDNKTYELDEKGWPASVHMGNTAMNESTDPVVNGYRYLVFDDDINTTTWSGCVEYGVDIWYYTFRWSDREIMSAYDNQPPPPGLTTLTATSEAYMLQTAVDLLFSEVWEASGEDGAKVADEGSTYDPSPGLSTREKLLNRLQKRLDDLVRSLILGGVTGVLID
jgi:hypothetical protein